MSMQNNKKTKAAYARVYGLTVTEYQEQINLIQYIDIQYKGIIYCASAGGLHTSDTQAIKMKRAGYKAGFPDLFFYEPRGGYHGLAIELKRSKGGTTSPLQKEWLEALKKRGYYATVAQGFDAAKKVIDWYMRLEANLPVNDAQDSVVICATKKEYNEWVKNNGKPGVNYHHIQKTSDLFGLNIMEMHKLPSWYLVPQVGEIIKIIESKIK